MTSNTKSGESTENKISGLNSSIYSTACFIFLLIKKMFFKTSIIPKKVISLFSKGPLILSFFK